MPLVPQAIISPNAFEFKINNFACNLTVSAQQNLCNILTAGADLYHGYLLKDVFVYHAQKTLNQKIQGMLHALDTEITDQYAHYLDFQLKMLYEGQTRAWQMPALVTAHDNRLTWHTGSTRILASWMCQSGNRSLPVILTDFDRSGPDAWLEPGSRCIVNDADLSQILGVQYAPYDQHSKDFSATNCDVYLQWHGYPGPCLHYVNVRGSRTLDWRNHDRVIYADKLMQRLKKLQRPVPIKVYCERSDQITDSSNLFSIQHEVAPNLPQALSVFSLQRIRHVKQGQNEIHLRDGAQLDLAQLLFWLDDSTVYIDRRDQFVLIMGGNGFITKDIDVSAK